MPEHDETDAPELAPNETPLPTRPDPGITEAKPKRRKSKWKRWGVEDKVVDGETK